MTNTLNPPEVWCKQLGIILHDEDGWKKDNKPFSDSITLAEFEDRMTYCGILYAPKALNKYQKTK